MNSNPINDEMRKALTLYLGNKWHWIANDAEIRCECGEMWFVRNIDLNKHENRQFDCPDDMDALRRKLVEKEDEKDFLEFAFLKYEDAVNLARIRKIKLKESTYIFWLIESPRFCNLVGEWLEVKNRNDKEENSYRHYRLWL